VEGVGAYKGPSNRNYLVGGPKRGKVKKTSLNVEAGGERDGRIAEVWTLETKKIR